MKSYTPQAKQLHLEICDRADKGEPLLQLLRTFDMHRSRFYHIYRRTRGVKWSQAHPREHLTRRNVPLQQPHIRRRGAI